MQDELVRLGAGGDAQLLDLHADGRGALRDDAAIERELLRLARHLRLQVADRSRDFRLLARAADADGIELGKLGAQLAVGLLQLLDRDLVLGALLRTRQAVVAGVVAAELVDDVQRESTRSAGARSARMNRRTGACVRTTTLRPVPRSCA